MEPAFDGTAVEIFAGGGGDFDDAAIFNVIVDWVGDHIFLVGWPEVVGVDVFDNFLK